ncbi:multidrug effflux MFS transporter [Flaviflexus equikiangi]|uniref:Multidrug effflux MFS transporter n=1 Tax=Flaviflexus equikiangi TaxID=2758573 RepID=A0ABS2TG20_9ACTO|nr:multidrug effflux MFS transporter [Flaviflexus equikiangi]MBM9433600.1 multidrug effflux MFS transporter [Flaviflexus equikiangi]
MAKNTPPSDRSAAFPTILLITLAILSSITPFATDLYLPAFLDIQDTFEVSASSVQLTLTTFLLGAGIGQVVFGPLSDRLGRRGPLLVGVALFALSSIGAAIAPSITILIAMRFLQGFSGSAGMVIGRAIVNDMARGFEAARILNLFMLIGGLAPIVAPVLGSALAEPLGWNGLLWIVAGIGMVSLAMALVWVPESHPAERRLIARDNPAGGSVANRQFISSTAVFVLSFMALMAYVSASPFVYQTVLGYSIGTYGLLFAGNSLILMVCSGLSARLVASHGPRPLLRIGVLALMLGSFLTLAVVLSPLDNSLIVVTLMISVGSLGFCMGNATALAMAAVPPARTGFGSAMLGLFQFAMAGAVSPLVGLAGEDSAIPMAIVMASAAFLAFGAFAATRTPTSDPMVVPAPLESVR